MGAGWRDTTGLTTSSVAAEYAAAGSGVAIIQPAMSATTASIVVQHRVTESILPFALEEVARVYWEDTRQREQ